MIWIIGCKGMLGKEVCSVFDDNGIAYTGSDIEVDITNPQVLGDFAKNLIPQPAWIINCSAYTAVDQAEDEPEKAYAINADGTRNIAEIAAFLKAKIIHLSTDYVFNGNCRIPYIESDQVDPIGVYGKTKADGERLLREEWDQHFIIRTAWLYGYHGKNFVQTMIRLMSDRDEISVVNDQHGSPTYAPHLAQVIYTMVSNNIDRYGTYHYTNEGQTTWFAFAEEIFKNAKALGIITSACSILPIPTSAYPTKAKRPVYSYLNKEKIKSALDLTIPDWKTGLNSYLNEVKKHA